MIIVGATEGCEDKGLKTTACEHLHVTIIVVDIIQVMTCTHGWMVQIPKERERENVDSSSVYLNVQNSVMLQ